MDTHGDTGYPMFLDEHIDRDGIYNVHEIWDIVLFPLLIYDNKPRDIVSINR